MSLKGPLALRSAMMLSTAAAPTPFTAARPKRTSPAALDEKVRIDSLMSGPMTLMPMRLHSFM